MFFDKFEYYLQTIIIQLLNFLWRISRAIKDDRREGLLQLMFVFVAVFFLMIYSGFATDIHLSSQLSRHITGLVLLLFIIIFSQDRELHHVDWRKAISVPMIVTGIAILIVSFIHPVGSGYRVFAVMLIAVFPALALVWNNRGDYDRLFDCIAYAVSWVGIAYLILCISLIMRGEVDSLYDVSLVRFKGTLSHPGNLSQVYTSVFCSGLYLLIQHFGRLRTVIYAAAVYGIGAGMLMLGQGRSCILACVASLISAVIFFIKYVDKGDIKETAAKLTAAAVVSFVVAAGVSNITVWFAPKDTASLTLPAGLEVVQVAEAADGTANSMEGRFSVEGQDLNSYSSGRIDLWLLVMRNLNMLGHDVEQQSIHDLTQNDWLIYAHNVFLEMSYRCGIPVGFLFLVLEYIACCMAVRYLFRNVRRETCLIFPIMFVIIYFTQSMLDCAGMPFILESGLYYYLCLIPMMDKRI